LKKRLRKEVKRIVRENWNYGRIRRVVDKIFTNLEEEYG
jgi:hypothetical protein